MRWCVHWRSNYPKRGHTTHVFGTVHSDHMHWLTNRAKTWWCSHLLLCSNKARTPRSSSRMCSVKRRRRKETSVQGRGSWKSAIRIISRRTALVELRAFTTEYLITTTSYSIQLTCQHIHLTALKLSLKILKWFIYRKMFATSVWQQHQGLFQWNSFLLHIILTSFDYRTALLVNYVSRHFTKPHFFICHCNLEVPLQGKEFVDDIKK